MDKNFGFVNRSGSDSSVNYPLVKKEFSNLEEDGVEGWRIDINPGYNCSKLYVPKGFDSKQPICKDDVTNLKIDLNTVTGWDEFFNSSKFFVQSFDIFYR